jgi:hypothetical protein
MMHRRYPLIVLAIVVAACGGGPPGGHHFRTYTEDDVRVAETTGGPAYSEPLFRFEEVLRLKQDPAQEASLLNRISSFERGPDGRLYIVDGGDCRVVVYEAEGSYRSTFGRRGSGPGEFQGPRLTAFDGDTLTIYDTGLRRASRFTTGGRLLDTFSQMNGGSPRDLVAHGDLLIGITSESQRPANIQFGRPRALITRAATGDTVAIVRGEFVPVTRFTDMTEPGGTYRGRYSMLQLGGYPEMVISPRHDIVVAQGNEGFIQVFSPLGEPRLRIRIEQPERPIDAAFRDRYFTFMDSVATARGRTMTADYRARYVFADKVGFSENLLVDDRGWLWLLDEWGKAFNAAPDRTWWHVVDAEGRYLGRAFLPGTPHAIRDGLLMSTWYDEETGEQIPTVYKIIPAVEGLRYP